MASDGRSEGEAAGALAVLKKRLRDARESQGKTEAWLAEVTQLSRGAVRNCLGGPAMPHRDTVERVGRALGVSKTSLLGLWTQAQQEKAARMTGTRAWWRVGRGRQVEIDGARAEVRDGDGKISYLLNRGMPRRRDFSTQEAQERPSLLLRADHQQIDFVGRRAVMESLREWRDPDGPDPDPVDVRLLHGPAGQGKSRLAIEFGAVSRVAGCSVLQVRHGTDQTASDMLDVEPALAPAEPGRPETLLLVVDYAERWPHQQLVDFLDDCREQGHRRVRVLLISRSVGGWWSTPTRYLTDWGIPFGDVRLPPLEEDEGIDRGMLYTRACAYFASAVDATMPDEPRDLTGDGFFTVLAVHMAALADVEAQRRGEAPPSSRAGISEYLVKREREQWERLLQSGRVAIGPDVFAQVVYTAALTGALPRNDAVAAVARVEVDCHETPAKVVKDHAVAYPVHQSGTVLEPLHPDLLAEDFLALLLPAEPAFSPLGDDWAVDAPRRLILGEALTVEEEQVVSAAWTKRALITLIEAARRWEHVTRRQLVPLLADHPELFRQAGSAAISRLADNLCIPESLLDALETALPFMDVELDAGAAALAERLTDYRLREAGADVYKRALVHRQLAHRLDHAGEYVKAAAEIQKDLEIFRELKDRDEHHLARFAVDLDWAGVIFTRSGDHVRGLEATREAIGIETELVERVGRANPELADEYRRMLTYSLGNLAGRPGLSAEERRDEAREGARLSRQLIGEGDPAQDGIELAGCLHNLGCALIDLGEFDEALEHLHSAVAIRRSQTHRHFGYYAPLLEIVLFDLRDCHAAMGSLDAALTIAEEHVRLLRTLAEASEGRFDDRLEAAERRLRDLARSAD